VGVRKVVLAFFASAALGLVIWIFTNSTIASCFAAVVAMAAAVAVLFASNSLNGSSDGKVKSRVSVRRSKNADITGAALKTIPKQVDSDVNVRHIEGGEVTGVRED
jgi:hypothetical protein